MEELRPVDHAALKVNQATIVALNLLAFVLNQPWLAIATAVFMLIGAFVGKPAFGFLYRSLLRKIVKPQILADHPEPHRFAQGLGGTMLLLGVILSAHLAPTAGWVLVWLVILLAGLNLTVGFCAGCFVYYWLARWKAPGFHRQPPPGVLPGFRPKREWKND